MFIQPVTGYRKVVTPAFRSQAENPLLKQSDITRLDSKLVIGRAPGACRYENQSEVEILKEVLSHAVSPHV